MTRALPIIIVLLAIVAVWYAAAIGLNAPWQNDVYRRGDMVDVPFTQFMTDTWNQEKPVLPAAHRQDDLHAIGGQGGCGHAQEQYQRQCRLGEVQYSARHTGVSVRQAVSR